MSLRILMRALRSRNFRLFFAGQGISLIGTWMQQVAMNWLVYRLTGSAFILGLVGFVGQIPTFLLAPLAGVMADRLERRALIMATQSSAMIQALLLAFLVLTDLVQVWHVVLLSLILGLINTFDIPARQSFLVEMVDERQDLGNAIALNSSIFNSARLIGPTIAGLTIASAGEGACFMINAASYLSVIAALAAMRLRPKDRSPEKHPIMKELREGIVYAMGFAPIRGILLLISLVSLAGMPYAVLMPVFAKDILHGDARTFGFLMTAAGCGALTSTIYLASRRTVIGLDALIASATILFGSGIAAFALSGSFRLSLALLYIAGLGGMALVASSNTIVQSLVDDDKRGRVMSLFTMSFIGMAPIGSLIAGGMAHLYGVRITIFLGGLSCLAGGIVFAFNLPGIRRSIGPILAQKDIH